MFTLISRTSDQKEIYPFQLFLASAARELGKHYTVRRVIEVLGLSIADLFDVCCHIL